MSAYHELSKSEMLRRSMRCFVLGWWSLVPLAGIVPALLALADFYAVVIRKGSKWNAARTRLTVGAILAALGLMLTFIIGAILVVVILNKISET